MNGTLRIYACGGAGVNVAMNYRNHPAQSGFADIEVCFIDTSRSNFPEGLLDSEVFVIEGTDGSGKVRSSNYQSIANNIPQVLNRFKPGDFNIVLGSGAGGSGSVFGPLILTELVKHNHPSVGMVVGSFESLIAATNTLNTLKSIDNLARTNSVPLAISFFNNKNNSQRKAVDDAVKYSIAMLSCLVSRQHHELDTADIANWLRYDKNPNNQTPASMAILDIVPTDEEAMLISYPISVASIHTGSSEIGSVEGDYKCAGIMSGDLAVALGYEQHHFIITVNDVPELIQSVNAERERLLAQQAARPKVQAIVEPNSVTTNDGMVL